MNDITFEQAWNYGGPLMWVLAGLSVFALAVFLFLWVAHARWVFLPGALMGLLGTVLGMFQAFGGIAADVSAGAKPVVLAQGVSQAIVTTIFGLVVAIPCLVCQAFMRRRAAKRVAELEEAVEQITGGGRL